MRHFAGAAVVLLVAGGCGSSPFDNSLLIVNATDSGLGANQSVSLTVMLENGADGHCPVSTAATLTVGDQNWPFAACEVGGIPLAQNADVSIEIRDGADKADAVIGGLAPGMDATIATPASGTVAPSSQVTINLPPALQALEPLAAEYTYVDTDDPTYAGELTYESSVAAGLLSVQAPMHTGHFKFWVPMNSADPGAAGVSGNVVSCSGFATCASNATTTVGPLSLDVEPAS